ncbi:hypothetical protein [Pedobacter antarcticus]|uniref:hypothetical protein n=1 Tax=Pedobacter antarcticus TaxID=34086 RepID=UPI00292DFEE4|nr:hypothetical protein [Pedobacter antarcticus]
MKKKLQTKKGSMPLPEFVIKIVMVLLFAAAAINVLSGVYQVANDYNTKNKLQPKYNHGKTN